MQYGMNTRIEGYYRLAKSVYENAVRDAGQFGFTATASRVGCVVRAAELRFGTDRIERHSIVLGDPYARTRIYYSEVYQSWVVSVGLTVINTSGPGIEGPFEDTMEWIAGRVKVIDPDNAGI